MFSGRGFLTNTFIGLVFASVIFLTTFVIHGLICGLCRPMLDCDYTSDNVEDRIMHQMIPEHPASYAADAAIVAFIVLTVFFMVLVW